MSPVETESQRSKNRRGSQSAHSGGKLTRWYHSHRNEVRAGAFAFGFAFFLSHGLPLWDDDYAQWLAQAQVSFFDLLGRFLLPVTSEPNSWGYSDRPLQVLIYRILHTFFGYWGTGYFFVKSLVFGALVGYLYGRMTQMRLERRAIRGILILFTVSTNVVAALLWHSDFAFYAQLVLAWGVFWSVDRIDRGVPFWGKGPLGLAPEFVRFALTLILLTYFGTKIRGDVRMLPLILALYVGFYHRARAKHLFGVFGVALLASIPWSTALFKHLPPFIPGSQGWQGWTFAPFSLKRVFDFAFLDLFSVESVPLSFFGGVGVVLTVAAAIFFCYQFYRDRIRWPDRRWGLALVWLSVALIGAGMLAPQSYSFQLRYTAALLVPASILFALIADSAFREFGSSTIFRTAFTVMVAAQCGIHLYRDIGFRKDMGHTVTAIDRIYSSVEQDFANAQLLLGPGFLPYAFRDSKAQALVSRKPIGSVDEVKAFPAGGTVVASWTPYLDARFVLVKQANGCASSVFDSIFSCQAKDGAVLLKYIGSAPEVDQAQAHEKAGNLQAARQSYDGYLQREPNNLGASFMAGILAYRLGDFARMEQIYDHLGSYFPGHPAVVYNWGLSKQGLNKFPEATRLFERAYALVPKDYAIGFNLADSYYKQGKKNRAIATVTDLLKTYPDSKPMKDALANWSK